MRQFFAFFVSLLLWQQTALGQLGEHKASPTPEFAHVAVVHSMSDSLGMQTRNTLEAGMKTYHQQPTNLKAFIAANANDLSSEDLKFLKSLNKKFPANVTLPKFNYRDGKYEASALGVKISFSDIDYWKNRIFVNGQVFKLNFERELAGIYHDLNRQFPAKTSMALPLVGDAYAAIPIIVYLVILAIGALGLSFWMKSKEEKRKILKQAMEETNRDIKTQADMCEQSRSDSGAYENTFDLLSNMIQGEGQGNMVSKAMQVGMFRSIQENSNLSCSQSLDAILEETIGEAPSRINASAREIRQELCGYPGEEGGSFARLRGCMARFYSTHKELTVRRRNITPSRFDRDAELIRDRYQYQNAVR